MHRWLVSGQGFLQAVVIVGHLGHTAQTDLNKAIAELQRATGNSLTANKVTVSVK